MFKMKVFFVILCCVSYVCGNYGDNSQKNQTDKPMITVTFDIHVSHPDGLNEARCHPEVENGNYSQATNKLVTESGRKVRLQGGLQQIYGHIQKVNCSYNNGSGPQRLAEEYNIQNVKNGEWFEEPDVEDFMFGTWSCRLRFNYNTKKDVNPVDNEGYTYVICNITVENAHADPVNHYQNISSTTSTTSTITTTTTHTGTTASHNQHMDINKVYYIGGGVGIIVLLIIIGQTIALCYFRKKARPQRRRMDNMGLKSRIDGNDRARYSSPPCKKSKEAVPECDRDSHIYEMVVVNANYNKASELAAAMSETNRQNTSIRNRPPLPLPDEIPEAAETLPRTSKKPSRLSALSSTLSRISTRSSTNLTSKKKGKELSPPPVQVSKKAPARPPKQIDEESLPGSLKRPAKPPAPATASSSASAFKPGFIPKPNGTDSQMSELKNILKNRHIGNDTPKSSPAAKLEKKEPPKATKLFNTPIKPSIQPKHPPVPNKPGVQQNEMKLILPKIEANSLKTPKPGPAPKPVEMTPLVKKLQPPMSNVAQKRPTVAHTHETAQTQPMPTTQKWPLVTQETQTQATSNTPKWRPVAQETPTPTAQKWPPVTQESQAKPPPKKKDEILKSPIQNRPLPNPDGRTLANSDGRPLPPDLVPQGDLLDMPIYQMADEDGTQDTDDEEWTYEQLDKYNIYNM